jgi:hypothetical protein
LTDEEIGGLNKLVDSSIKTEDVSKW